MSKPGLIALLYVLLPQRYPDPGWTCGIKSARRTERGAKEAVWAGQAHEAQRQSGTEGGAEHQHDCCEDGEPRRQRLLRYSSRKARSGHGPARVEGVLTWPRHTNFTVATAPLDPCVRGTSAHRGHTRRKDVR